MCALLLPANLAAQQNATVQGIVVDESQGVMPGATVTATEISTGVPGGRRHRRGRPVPIRHMPPGQYKIRIELSGFATVESRHRVARRENVTVPRVAMKVAAMQETITVT